MTVTVHTDYVYGDPDGIDDDVGEDNNVTDSVP